MGIYEELQARGLMGEVAGEEGIREVGDGGKGVF